MSYTDNGIQSGAAFIKNVLYQFDLFFIWKKKKKMHSKNVYIVNIELLTLSNEEFLIVPDL